MLDGPARRNVEQGDDDPGSASARRGLSPQRLLPLAILVIGLAAFVAFDLDRFLSLEALHRNRQALTDWVARAGGAAWLVYVLVYAAAVAFSVPGGALMTVAGGFLFGPLIAAALTVVGATAGATALFLAARYALADYLRSKAGPAIRRMEAGFNENALSYLLFLRLVPLFPFWLVNLVPAFLGVHLRTYVLATAVGIVPGTIVFSLVGDGLGAVLDAGGDVDFGIIFEPRFFAPIFALALLALVPVAYKKLRRPR